MSNCMIGFPNRADASTLSSGSWVTTLPQANLQNRIIGKVARTTDATLASTKMDINLGASKKITLVSLRNHNISLDGLYRLRGASDAGFTTVLYDSGWQSVWPAVYDTLSLDWEDDNWWSGQYTAEQITGYTPELIMIVPTITLAQYWRIEINDTANTAGYLQFGRLFIGPAWQPSMNMGYSTTTTAWETKTDVQEAIGGAEYFQQRMPYRVVKFTLDVLPDSEGLANAFEIDRQAGIDKEVLFVYDPADTTQAIRRRFLGRLRTLTPLEYPDWAITRKAYEIKELL